MRRFGVPTIAAAATLAAALSAPAQAAPARTHAEPVLVLSGGKVERTLQRFSGPDELPAPPAQSRNTTARAAATKKPPKGDTTRRALAALVASGQIDQPTYDAR